jgi:hypothetical protein
MISIQSSLTELERSHQFREAVLECYLRAVKNVSHYGLELDEEVTRQFRKHISGLVEEIFLGKVDLLAESRATLRGLLRDFRDATLPTLPTGAMSGPAPRAPSTRFSIPWPRPTATARPGCGPPSASCAAL